jgi:SAM-dependent methyltransferase
MNIEQLLKDSDFRGSYHSWRLAREILNQHIAGGGMVLDLGCANGFLLACLLLWHPQGFIPFGIDIDPARIEIARRLMSAFTSNFYVHNFFAQEWPVVGADIIIAPWQPESSFITNCLQRAPKVIFTAYDDRLASGLNVLQECRSSGLEILKSDIIPGITQAISVRGRAQFQF